MKWQASDVISVFALMLSIIFSTLTLILNRKEKPNLMPYGQNIFDNNLILDFNNPSDTNIHNLTILINGFNSELEEVSHIHFQDKYLFTISAKSMFNYSFNLAGDWFSKNFYFRVRLKGEYLSRFPLFPKRKFEQVIWYSALVSKIEGEKISVKILTTHRDELLKLDSRHKVALTEYGKDTDKKFNSRAN